MDTKLCLKYEFVSRADSAVVRAQTPRGLVRKEDELTALSRAKLFSASLRQHPCEFHSTYARPIAYELYVLRPPSAGRHNYDREFFSETVGNSVGSAG